ncbi:hypothetical protein Ciccas_012445 [Cichlidogyrus casuarinus]|uniref:Uncharacterized protein n=1 Tax=Cichlidogyrus casuarinus TaxID=1844966 RepID=A0ABD2PNC9_9PLAT
MFSLQQRLCINHLGELGKNYTCLGKCCGNSTLRYCCPVSLSATTLEPRFWNCSRITALTWATLSVVTCIGILLLVAAEVYDSYRAKKKIRDEMALKSGEPQNAA